jgi:hypothetical protein
MTKEEVITLLCEHFSEGLVITIVDAIAKDEREECAKVCEDSVEYAGDTLAEAIRARGQE